MKDPVRLITTSGDDLRRQQALQMLSDSEVPVENVTCPDAVAEWFQCPYIQSSAGTFAGLEGIQFFAERIARTTLQH
jgi:hypothetical protein